MSFGVVKGVFTAPTVNGTDTVISGLTDPKAIIVWTTAQTSTGAIDGNGVMSIGFATYDGSAVQQCYMCGLDLDNVGTADTAAGLNTTACLKIFSATTPTVDAECDLVSMDSSSVTLDWVDAPASAILVHYLILCGTDITGARAGSHASGGATPEDFTINTGFGQPDLLFFITRRSSAAGDAATTWAPVLGVAKSDTVRQMSGVAIQDGAASMNIGRMQKARAFGHGGSASWDSEADLDTKASWPTDGYRLAWPDLAASGWAWGYLALKGTFQSAIGTNTVPTAGSPPVTQDNACGFAPLGGLVWGANITTGTTVDFTNTDLGYWWVAGTDMTNEGFGGISNNDGETVSFNGRVHSETKGAAFYLPAAAAGSAPGLQSEGDTSASGNNFRISWNDIDSVAREYCYVMLGAAAAAGASSLVWDPAPPILHLPY